MPPLPAVPGVLKIQLKHSFESNLDVLPRFYMAYTGTAPTGAQLNTLAGVIATSWGTNIKSLAPSQVTLTSVIIQDLSTSSSASGVTVVSTAGTRTGGPIAKGSAVLMNFHVARRYRGGKPRAYMPWGTQTDIAASGLWSTTLQTACNTGWNALITAIIAAPWAGGTITGQVNVSYYEGFTVFTGSTGRARNISKLRVGGPVVDTITAPAASLFIASQRRRNRK